MKAITTLAATLGAALLLAGAPALATAAETQTAPIRLDNVQIFPNSSYDDAGAPGWADVAFTNDSAVTATEVVFVLEVNGKVVDRFNDVGSFAPGVTINHRFPDSDMGTGQQIAVEQATFADGSAWVNPAVSEVASAGY